MRETPEHEREMATPAGRVRLRPEQAGDDAFLLDVYASTREEELKLTGWDAPTRRAFVNQQFRAMRHGYASMFPKGEYSIILLEGRAIGRQVLDRDEERICVVDMALLPAWQGRGIGTALMQSVLREAAEAKLRVQLHVVRDSRATNLYRRLGFKELGEANIYQEMVWRPA